MHSLEHTHGILNPAEGLRHFQLERYEPEPELRDFVERLWSVRWQLPSGTSFAQEVLPQPRVNLAFEPTHAAVHGIGTQRQVAMLTGEGWVVGVKFRPGAFFSFSTAGCSPMVELIDRIVPVAQAYGLAGERVAHGVMTSGPSSAALTAVQAFLLSLAPRLDDTQRLVAELIEHVERDRSIARADQLAAPAGMSVRSLHRHFAHYVGVGPKWVIRRVRAQEAAERVASGAEVDWAALALELGYHDQAHLIRDFKAQIGETPELYRERCRSAVTTAADGGNSIGQTPVT
jgi:AraC-like DNA-binding protein